MEAPEECGKDAYRGGVFTVPVGLELPCNGSAHGGTVIIDTGASANLAGADWLKNHNAIHKALGRPLAAIAPALASFRNGDGRVGNVHRAALIPIAIVGRAGQFMAYVVEADIPALLGKEGLETLGGHLNFRERVLTLEPFGADIPLEMNAAGRYLSNMADFPESSSARKYGSCTDGRARRMENHKSLFQNDALFFMDVTPKTQMRPAGKRGLPRILSRLDTAQVGMGGVRPGGKILPSLRSDGTTSEPTLDASADSSRRPSSAAPSGRGIACPSTLLLRRQHWARRRMGRRVIRRRFFAGIT